MNNQVGAADFVLVVFTERYTARSTKPKKSGVRFESILILQHLYDAGMNNDKFIPVVFNADETKHIFDWLKSPSYYVASSDKGYESLRRRLLNDPPVKKPPLGKPQRKGPNQ